MSLNNPALHSVTIYEAGEIERVVRAKLALILHKLPSEIDEENWQALQDILVVRNEDMKRAT